MPVIARAEARDIIALAWFQLGYRPRESILLIGLSGPRRRAGLVVRADLPPPGGERSLLHRLALPLRRSGAEAVVGLVVSDGACDPPPPPVARWAERELPRAGLTVVDLIAVGRTGYRSFRCRDAACCPPKGRPLTDVLSGPAAAHFVLAGRTVADDEAGLVADVAAPPDPGPAGEGATAGRGTGGSTPPPGGPQARALLGRWREALAEHGSDPELTDALGPALADVRVRDAVMLAVVPGSGTAPEALLDHRSSLGRGSGVDLDRLMTVPPDVVVLERARLLLAAAARGCPAGARAGVLAALAWLAWWAGDGARARLLAGLADADQPGHRLAGLVGQLLAAGVPPPWTAALSVQARSP